MSDTANPPTFEITYLGSTELHDVYDVALYPALVGNLEAQRQHKQQAVHILAQAKRNERHLWVALNLGYLTTAQIINLSYRVGLPFMHEPMMIKVYGRGQIVVTDAATKGVDWLMRHTFKMEFVANRQAALPPGFVSNE